MRIPSRSTDPPEARVTVTFHNLTAAPMSLHFRAELAIAQRFAKAVTRYGGGVEATIDDDVTADLPKLPNATLYRW